MKGMNYSGSAGVARGAVTAAIASGKLVKQPCEVCGEPNSQAHHRDYRKPLKVTWLCLKHHVLEHRRLHDAGIRIPGGHERRPTELSERIVFQLSAQLFRQLISAAEKDHRKVADEVRNLLVFALAAREKARKS